MYVWACVRVCVFVCTSMSCIRTETFQRMSWECSNNSHDYGLIHSKSLIFLSLLLFTLFNWTPNLHELDQLVKWNHWFGTSLHLSVYVQLSLLLTPHNTTACLELRQHEKQKISAATNTVQNYLKTQIWEFFSMLCKKTTPLSVSKC